MLLLELGVRVTVGDTWGTKRLGTKCLKACKSTCFTFYSVDHTGLSNMSSCALNAT